MADRPRLRWRWVAFAVTLVLAGGAVVVLVGSLRQREDARADLKSAQVALRTERATTSRSATALVAAHGALHALQSQLGTLGPEAAAIGKLDEQDLETVRAAVQAGLAGNLDAYNQAVSDRAALDPEHDASVEQLRQQANAIITALDQLRG